MWNFVVMKRPRDKSTSTIFSHKRNNNLTASIRSCSRLIRFQIGIFSPLKRQSRFLLRPLSVLSSASFIFDTQKENSKYISSSTFWQRTFKLVLNDGEYEMLMGLASKSASQRKVFPMSFATMISKFSA